MKAAFDDLWRRWCLAYNRRALREMDCLHPDVPKVILRIMELERRG